VRKVIVTVYVWMQAFLGALVWYGVDQSNQAASGTKVSAAATVPCIAMFFATVVFIAALFALSDAANRERRGY